MRETYAVLQAHIDFSKVDLWPEPAELNATDAVNQRWL